MEELLPLIAALVLFVAICNGIRVFRNICPEMYYCGLPQFLFGREKLLHREGQILPAAAPHPPGCSYNAEETVRENARFENERALSMFFNSMSRLLAHREELYAPSFQTQQIARHRSLSALQFLDNGRKAQVLHYLVESKLIKERPIINLFGADLRGIDLEGANLKGTELRGVRFNGANLKRVNFEGADLRFSDFTGADFTGANLSNANLIRAKIENAIFLDAKTDETLWKAIDQCDCGSILCEHQPARFSSLYQSMYGR